MKSCLKKIKRPNSVTTDIYHRKSSCAAMAVGDLKPPGPIRERVGSGSHTHTRSVQWRARDRVVSGSHSGEEDSLDTGAGSQGSVFGVSDVSTASASFLESQVI